MYWEDILKQLPKVLEELFYKDWDGNFKVCKLCSNSFPNHKLFFTNKHFPLKCNKCRGYKIIPKNIGEIFAHLIPVGYKFCNKCSKTLPLDKEHFRANNKSKNGFSSTCKKCIYLSEYKYNPNKVLSINNIKLCNICNEIKDIELFKKVGKTRREPFCIDCEGKYKKRKTKYDQKYYQDNKEKRKIYYSKWKQNGGQVIRNIDEQKRKARKLNLKSDFTSEQWEVCKKFFNYSCAYCGISELETNKKYDTNLCQEHIIPVSSNGEYTVSNIVPSCKGCNSQKKTKSLKDFYNDLENKNILNFKRIISYLMQFVEISENEYLLNIV